MNNFDVYIPIDVHGPIKTNSHLNVQKHSSNNPAIMFQLFDGPFPLMLDDISKVSIAFTNTKNETVKGSGQLQVVNPHRGTISYVLSKDDITLFGLHTITLGITTGKSFFTVQCVAMCDEISDSLYEALTGDDSGDSGCNDNALYYGEGEFPCVYYNEYCRLCRRCKCAWYHNSIPRPVKFSDVKMCKNPFIFPPPVNYANLPDEYERAYYPTMIDDNGNLVITIDAVNYICDIGKDNGIYLLNKELETPSAFVGLYLGPKLIPYYKISEKVEVSDDFDVDSLFNG